MKISTRLTPSTGAIAVELVSESSHEETLLNILAKRNLVGRFLSSDTGPSGVELTIVFGSEAQK